MLGLVLPNSKPVLLKKITFENCRELYEIQDNKEAVVSFLNEFFITSNLNILEKFYCILHLRDVCIGNIIELRDYSFDIIQIQNELQEIADIKKVIKFDNNSITLNYPKNFSCSSLYEDSFIETILIDDEIVDYNNLDSDEKDLIFNYLPTDIKAEIKNFYNQNIKKLKIEFLIKGSTVNLNLDDWQIITFLANILVPIDSRIYRDYIFILSERIKDVMFLRQSTYLDVRDYMDLYAKEVEERKAQLKTKN